MNNIKTGDIINVINENANNGADMKIIKIQAPTMGSMSQIAELRNKSVFHIEHNYTHDSLKKYGVKIGKYSLKSEPIETIAFKEDHLRVNMDIEIPYDDRVRDREILDTPFLDEEQAADIANELNRVELNKLIDLKEIIEKAVEHQQDVVDNKRV